MRRKILVAVGIIVAFGVTYFVGMFVNAEAAEKRRANLVAVAWGDGSVGPAFYGAYVELEPISSGYSVQAYIAIGRGNQFYRDCGEIGRVATAEEAVARWSKIEWREDGLHIGNGADQYFLPRKEVETHR